MSRLALLFILAIYGLVSYNAYIAVSQALENVKLEVQD